MATRHPSGESTQTLILVLKKDVWAININLGGKSDEFCFKGARSQRGVTRRTAREGIESWTLQKRDSSPAKANVKAALGMWSQEHL